MGLAVKYPETSGESGVTLAVDQASTFFLIVMRQDRFFFRRRMEGYSSSDSVGSVLILDTAKHRDLEHSSDLDICRYVIKKGCFDISYVFGTLTTKYWIFQLATQNWFT